jgi:hypothetical protein
VRDQWLSVKNSPPDALRILLEHNNPEINLSVLQLCHACFKDGTLGGSKRATPKKRSLRRCQATKPRDEAGVGGESDGGGGIVGLFQDFGDWLDSLLAGGGGHQAIYFKDRTGHHFLSCRLIGAGAGRDICGDQTDSVDTEIPVMWSQSFHLEGYVDSNVAIEALPRIVDTLGIQFGSKEYYSYFGGGVGADVSATVNHGSDSSESASPWL